MSDDRTVMPVGEEFERQLGHVRLAPAVSGVLELIVCRPEVDEREVLDTAVLDEVEGLVGDSWLRRGSSRTADGSADPWPS